MDMDKTALGTMDSGEATQMMAAPVSNATEMAMSVQCPVCRTANPPSETYCIDCGFLLASAPVGVAEISEAPSAGKLVATDAREFPLNVGANSVGRESADVLVLHNTVSRSHATVTVEDGHAYVEDIGSTNGTYVSGRKLAAGEKAELTDGCDVTFGSYTLKYEAPAKTEEPAESGAPVVESSERTQMVESEPESGDQADQDFDIEPVGESSDAASTVEEIEHTDPEEPVAPAGRLVSKDDALSFDIRDGISTIGRREGDNDIVIPDPYCSGRHAEVSFADGAFTLTDIGSTNGTLINGVRLEPNAPRQLVQGDEITLGRTVFKVEA